MSDLNTECGEMNSMCTCCSVVSEALAGADWELATPPRFLSFFSFFCLSKIPEFGQQLSAPFARPDIPLDSSCAFVGGASLAAKKEERI